MQLRQLMANLSWVGVWWRRIALIVVAVHVVAFLGSGGEDIRLAPFIAVLFALGMGWIGIADARRRNELLFLQSLGISPTMIAAVWVISVALIEFAIISLSPH